MNTFLGYTHRPFTVPAPHDPRPGRFVRHLDFNHFRTIGMRRSIDEGVNSRFVTGDRVEAVIKVWVLFPSYPSQADQLYHRKCPI